MIYEAGTGLCAIHNNNIIHRDIKPDNIFINKDNIYKIGDFDVIRILEENTSTHQATTLIGTRFIFIFIYLFIIILSLFYFIIII
jgi:serine/threonine protein kinase